MEVTKRAVDSLMDSGWTEGLSDENRENLRFAFMFWLDTRHNLIKELADSLESYHDGRGGIGFNDIDTDALIQRARNMVEVDEEQQVLQLGRTDEEPSRHTIGIA